MLELTLFERARLFASELRNEMEDRCGEGTIFSRFHSIVIPCYKYSVLCEMRQRAAQLPEARFTYDNHLCTYVNKECRVIVEIPESNHATYITGRAGEKSVLAAFDLYEEDVLRIAEEITGEKISCAGGGELRYDGSILIHGTSKQFGTADHNNTIRLLKYAGLEGRVMEPSPTPQHVH